MRVCELSGQRRGPAALTNQYTSGHLDGLYSRYTCSIDALHLAGTRRMVWLAGHDYPSSVTEQDNSKVNQVRGQRQSSSPPE